MEQQQGQTGPGGRKFHIAHRRSPSEMTPLIAEQLALQQQIEFLQAQQQQMLSAQQQQMLNAQQQYVNMGIIPTAQNPLNPVAFSPLQSQIPHLSPQQQHGFQFPQQQSPPIGGPTQLPGHRRNASGSAAPTGTAASTYADQSSGGANRDSGPQRRSSGGQGPGSTPGHARRHSLALPEAKRAAELAQARRATGQPGFQFPASGPGATSTQSSAGASAIPTGSSIPTTDASANTSSSTTLGPPRTRIGGHGRSQSMAVGGANGRTAGAGRIGAFQFPGPMTTSDGAGIGQSQSSSQNVERKSSQGHTRSGSRNFDQNWRTGNQNQSPTVESQNHIQPQSPQPFTPGFQPGHRSRASMGASIGSFTFPAQSGLLIPGAPSQGIFVNPATVQPQLLNTSLLQQQQLTQLQLQQAAQALNVQQLGLGQVAIPQTASQNLNIASQQQQQRKTLFTPYLPQASLPALLSNGQLVSGILRVNKKNRSDAYVSTPEGVLDADIFICGSKDRNRALEGDLVAVELLDVDEVWNQKREKEEKKKRKDNTDGRVSTTSGNATTGTDGQEQTGNEGGGMRRRGSLRQRPTQKKNDDVEVEGQSLLLVEEEEISDEQKPLYAGHIVAVIERVAGQMFSGTLGLLRPSSQATKEKQEAERQAREGPNTKPQPERQQEKPKIVWFKPTDKRVPLIAIPTEQAPRDFVENHQAYANKIFVACIKRWPITSLHPFGTLVEQLGEMGDAKIETDALLRDNNFGPDEFAEAVMKSVGHENWTLEAEGEAILQGRKDLRDEQVFTILPTGISAMDIAYHVKIVRDGVVQIGTHVADVTHFVKPNSLVDREAKKRGTGVTLINRTVPLLPAKLADELLALRKNEDRLTVSVVFHVEKDTGKVIEGETWIGKSIIKSTAEVSHASINKTISKAEGVELEAQSTEAVEVLYDITQKFRRQRLNLDTNNNFPLRLLSQLDDELLPVEENIFHTTYAQGIVEELSVRANAFVASKIAAALGEKALLRRHLTPIKRRLDQFSDRMNALSLKIDTSSSATLQNSLLKLDSDIVRKGMQTLLIKAMHRAKYCVAGKVASDLRLHYLHNLSVQTHFTSPSRRYADIIVHRQLETALSDGAVEFTEDLESLVKIADQCNVKKDSAKNAQEQSIHFQLCRAVDERRVALGGDLICEAVVINVYESAFDVLIPEYGFEKRVHCDQLPLKKAEFDKNKRILELYWEKGIQSNIYIPEDERPKSIAAIRAANATAAAHAAAAAAQAAKEQEELQRRMMDISSLSINDVDALFDDDADDDEDSEETSEQPSATRPTQSMPPSPTRISEASSQVPHRTRSDPKMAHSATESTGKLEVSIKERYSHMFTLREENGDNIQEVREMTMVPVFLKTELNKSPPCLTIRSLNPYAF